MRRILLVAHDPRWAEAFDRESLALVNVMGNQLVVIHHIGSTAILDIRAKPIIDMLAVVKEVARVEEQNPQLQALGYEALGECGIPGRRYFRKDDAAGNRTHQIHTFQIGSPQIERHLVFRDFLKAHREYAEQYEALKERLAELYPFDIEAYANGKDEFIKEMVTRAVAWKME